MLASEIFRLDHFLRNLGWAEAAGLFLGHNLFIFGAALALGWAMRRAWAHRPVAAPPRNDASEWAWALGNVGLNTLTTLAGWQLWCRGWIAFRTAGPLAVLLDLAVLLVLMDLGMYFLHRVAHHPVFYRYVHSLHHRYTDPRPLTLFVLHPLENLGFGALWLAVICLYSPTWVGMSVYLGLNVFFGMVGHLGVEPFPTWWRRIPVLGLLADATFHTRHHQEPGRNYGFYTVVWDRLLGTWHKR